MTQPANLLELAAKVEHMAALIERCERGDNIPACLVDTALACDRATDTFGAFMDAHAFNEAAIAMLPAGAVWRKYTDNGVTVYGRSPYGSMQERYDGFSPHFPLALAAAFLRLQIAPLQKALAQERKQ